MIIPTLLLYLATAATQQPERAMWVWYGDKVVENPKEESKFFQFLRAPKGNPNSKISVIWISRCDLDRPDHFGELQKFVADAHRRSVRVDYLCGDNSYILPDHFQDGLAQLDMLISYNRTAPPKARFDAIQYDIEPYLMKGWPTPQMLSDYLGFYDKCNDRIRQSGQKILLGATMPRWFDLPEQHGIYKSLIDRTDYIANMDYVQTAHQFVDDAKVSVQYAAKTGKKMWLGVEVSELKDEPTATFYALGNHAIEEAFKAANKAFQSSPGYAGVAIEHYDTYQSLRP
jgi:hypothetical protein